MEDISEVAPAVVSRSARGPVVGQSHLPWIVDENVSGENKIESGSFGWLIATNLDETTEFEIRFLLVSQSFFRKRVITYISGI